MKLFSILVFISVSIFVIACNDDVESKQPQNPHWSEKSEYLTWKEAKKYCDSLTENGYSDWRLPTIDELRTIVSNCSPVIPGGSCKISSNKNKLSSKHFSSDCESCSAFDEHSRISDGWDADSDWLWSSSSVSDYSNYVWGIDFFDAELNKLSKNEEYEARCYRTGKATKTEMGKPNKLIFSTPSEESIEWKDAKKYCENMAAEKNEDWRLPTIDELRRLVINCPQTGTDGLCEISEKEQRLSYDYFSEACEGCKKGNHSYFGDNFHLWSSSYFASEKSHINPRNKGLVIGILKILDIFTDCNKKPLGIDFSTGKITIDNPTSRIRCVRDVE